MYTLVGRSLESFLRSSYGDAFWQDLVQGALPERASRPLLVHTSPQETRRLVFLASRRLGKPVADIAESASRAVRRRVERRSTRGASAAPTTTPATSAPPSVVKISTPPKTTLATTAPPTCTTSWPKPSTPESRTRSSGRLRR